MRVAIIGNSGSGKSTLAGQIAAAHSIASLDLDTVAWEPGKIAVARPADAAAGDVMAFCSAHESWVVEGCYATLVRQTLEDSPILLFMNPGVDACVANCRNRPWEPHKYESQEVQNKHLEFLLTWVREYYSRDGDLSLAAHQALFDEYRGPKHKLTARVEPAQLDALTR
jgi:adenylate kinase family enzyme